MVLLKYDGFKKENMPTLNLHSTMVLLKSLILKGDTLILKSTFHYGSIKI